MKWFFFIFELKTQMITKEKLIQTINDLPDSFSIDDLFDRIVLLQKIEIGLEQSKSGNIRSTQEAKIKLEKWLSK